MSRAGRRNPAKYAHDVAAIVSSEMDRCRNPGCCELVPRLLPGQSATTYAPGYGLVVEVWCARGHCNHYVPIPPVT